MAVVDLSKFQPARIWYGKRDELGGKIRERDKLRRYTDKQTGSLVSRREAIKQSTGLTPEQLAAQHKREITQAEEKGVLVKRGKKYIDTSTGESITYSQALKVAERERPRLPGTEGSTPGDRGVIQYLLAKYAQNRGLSHDMERAYDGRFKTLQKLLNDYHYSALTREQSRKRAKAIARMMWEMGYRDQEDYDMAFY